MPSSPYHYQLPSKYRHLTSHPLAYEREKNALPAFLLVSLSLRKWDHVEAFRDRVRQIPPGCIYLFVANLSTWTHFRKCNISHTNILSKVLHLALPFWYLILCPANTRLCSSGHLRLWCGFLNPPQAAFGQASVQRKLYSKHQIAYPSASNLTSPSQSRASGQLVSSLSTAPADTKLFPELPLLWWGKFANLAASRKSLSPPPVSLLLSLVLLRDMNSRFVLDSYILLDRLDGINEVFDLFKSFHFHKDPQSHLRLYASLVQKTLQLLFVGKSFVEFVGR